MKALIIVDAQNDFFEGGALAVPQSNKIIPIINKLEHKFKIIIFTKDWHPADHKSFASNHKDKKVYDVIDLNGIQQVLWPRHCIQNTFGSEIHKNIIIPEEKSKFFLKGIDPEVDSYSAFFDNEKIHDTGLNDYLIGMKVTDVYICGLAADYCVKYTAIDAIELKFKTYLIADATKAVNINPDDYNNALKEMKNKGVKIIYSENLF